jgi:hypothetical protein
MMKCDLKKELKTIYWASTSTVTQVDVPVLRYLMIDGQGDPNTSPCYADAVESLFSVSYTAKFMLKKTQVIDYAVMPLEGLWWAQDMQVFTNDDKSQWQWTMMIMQPDFVSDALILDAIEQVRKKKPRLTSLTQLRLEVLEEGSCAQLMHVGPFSEEGPNIQRLHDFIDAKGARVGKHHEIYLSDIRRAAPHNWKTILRHPMRIQKV